MWLRRLLGMDRPDVPEVGSSPDELHEAKVLQREHKRHVDAISKHIDTVTGRMREDYRLQDERLAGKR